MQASGPGGALDSATSYGYDDASRLQTVSIGTLSATYTRSPNREVIGQIQFKNGANTVLTTTQGFDNLNRFKSVNSVTPANVTVSSTSYGFNNANQRVRTDREDATHWSFGYDDLGQVTSGSHKLSDETAILGEQFGYTFDRIGNRTQTVTNGQTATYTPNLLNQYDQRTVPGVMEITGQAATDATVTEGGQRALRQGTRFFKSVPVDNSAAPVKQAADVLAVKNLVGPDNKDAVMTQSVSQYVPKTPEVFSYDLDGNLAADGQWIYTWDGENRLIAMERITAAVTAGMPKRKLTFAYDGQSRRIEKKVYDWDAGMGSYQLSTQTNFAYDGWNLLAETDGSNAVVNRYVWGLDLSGTERGAGGAGGLLFERSGGANAIPSYDGNGNITALTDANSGVVTGRLEYGPFGETLRNTEPLNPFRFSTHYTEQDSGIIYAKYRFYSQRLGRWLSRDPAEEIASDNMFSYVSNRTIDSYDPFGLFDTKTGTASQLGQEWRRGTTPDQLNFRDGDRMAEQMKGDKDVGLAVSEITYQLQYKRCGDPVGPVRAVRSLGNQTFWQHVGYPFGFVGDLYHNPARAFLGSYDGTATLVYVDCCKGVARVEVHLWDRPRLGSATHLPTPWGYVELMNDVTGPVGTPYRTFNVDFLLHIDVSFIPRDGDRNNGVHYFLPPNLPPLAK